MAVTSQSLGGMALMAFSEGDGRVGKGCPPSFTILPASLFAIQLQKAPCCYISSVICSVCRWSLCAVGASPTAAAAQLACPGLDMS